MFLRGFGDLLEQQDLSLWLLYLSIEFLIELFNIFKLFEQVCVLIIKHLDDTE
jgi:hypothetical protein